MNCAEDSNYPRVTEIIQSVLGFDTGLLNWIRRSERLGIDTEEVLSKAANKGTKIHDYVKKTLCGEKAEIEEDFKPGTERLLEFLSKKEKLETEVSLKTDDPIKFQGHLDYLYFDNGCPVIADLKTGSKRIEVEMQLNGYGYLYWQNYGRVPSCLTAIYLKPDYLDIIHFKYNEYLWLSLLNLYAWKQKINWKV